MNTQKLLTILVCLCLIVVPASKVFSENSLKRKALKGLQGVHVVVGEIRPEAEQAGLYGNRIQTDVELRLRKAGIRVLTQEETLKFANGPLLYVVVNAMEVKTVPRLYVFSASVSVMELVTLIRKPFLSVPASTWKGTGWTGTVGRPGLKEYVLEEVGAMVDQFINHYLAANPPSKPVKPQPFKKD